MPIPSDCRFTMTTTAADDLIDVPPGLKGVAVADTTIGDVQGSVRSLNRFKILGVYRGEGGTPSGPLSVVIVREAEDVR